MNTPETLWLFMVVWGRELWCQLPQVSQIVSGKSFLNLWYGSKSRYSEYLPRDTPWLDFWHELVVPCHNIAQQSGPWERTGWSDKQRHVNDCDDHVRNGVLTGIHTYQMAKFWQFRSPLSIGLVPRTSPLSHSLHVAIYQSPKTNALMYCRNCFGYRYEHSR